MDLTQRRKPDSDESQMWFELDLSMFFLASKKLTGEIGSHLSWSFSLRICNKTLASKCEQGSRSLGCSGTMFQRDSPRFRPGTGHVPEQLLVIPLFSPDVPLWTGFQMQPSLTYFNEYFIHWKIPDAFIVIWRILHSVSFVPEHFSQFRLSAMACSGTFFQFSPRTMKFRAGVPAEKLGGFRH